MGLNKQIANLLFGDLKELKYQPIESGVRPNIEKEYFGRWGGTFDELRSRFLELKKNLNTFTPKHIATFKRVEDRDGSPIFEGERLWVSIIGGMYAPIEITECQEDCFTISTLEGHPEAGSITFRIYEGSTSQYFKIHSLARNRNNFYKAAYVDFGMMDAVQTRMWVLYVAKFLDIDKTAVEVKSEMGGI